MRPGAGNLPTLATPGFFPPGFVGMEPRAAAGMTPQGASVRGTDAATAANANRIQSPVERIDPMSGNPFAEDEPSSAQGRAAPPSKR